MYDAIVVGGGTAGLSAALVLGRARRRVLVVDAGHPRNAPAAAAHGYFTRDGTPPHHLLAVGREQLRSYPSVELRPGEAIDARRLDDAFAIDLNDGTRERSRALVLATGVRDDLPAIPGFRDFWGRGVYHCPYCHGWEVRDHPLAVYANGEVATHLAPLIRQWSRDLILLTDGPATFDATARARFEALGIRLIDEPLARLEGTDRLERIVFAGGASVARTGLFVRPPQRPRNELARQLGCALVEDGPVGLIQTDATQQTTVPGVYAAGDVATPMQQLVTAAATGAMAAAMINHALVQQEFDAVAVANGS